MRLLIYGLNHAPEPTGIGKYTGELVAWLAARGHDLRVIAAPPYYPDWRIAADHSAWLWQREQREAALLRRFDRVSTIAEAMVERLAAKGVPSDRRGLFRNWVDCQAIRPLDGASKLRAELGLDGTTVALYAGAMGEKQGVETLIELAGPLAAAGVALVLAGAGAARPRLDAALAGRPGVHLLAVQP